MIFLCDEEHIRGVFAPHMTVSSPSAGGEAQPEPSGLDISSIPKVVPMDLPPEADAETGPETVHASNQVVLQNGLVLPPNVVPVSSG